MTIKGGCISVLGSDRLHNRPTVCSLATDTGAHVLGAALRIGVGQQARRLVCNNLLPNTGYAKPPTSADETFMHTSGQQAAPVDGENRAGDKAVLHQVEMRGGDIVRVAG